jgi:hypothetical protein
MQYLLTWNCTHLANAALRPQIEAVCRAAGFEPPLICTPEGRVWAMTEDDVLLGVRAAREAYARSHNFDVHAMVEDLRARDEAGDWPVVRLPPPANSSGN